MPRLYEMSSNRLLGTISQADLDLLIAQFEEESSRDRDYYVNNDTVALLAEAGASAELLDTLKLALDAAGEADVRWEQD